jgi:cell division protein FtsI/penicillin-binding protein 2
MTPTPLGSVDLDEARVAWAPSTSSHPATTRCLARMYREIFFPGSTFKVVTAAAGLDGPTS